MLFCSTRSKVSLKKFYKKQNDLVEAWKEDEKVLHRTGEGRGETELTVNEGSKRAKLWDTRLAMVVVTVNVLLIGAKMTTALLSHSLSIVASVVDSAMDVTSGLVIWYTCRMIERSNKHHYPVGLNRLEPLTTLIVGLIMIFANVVVIQEAAVDTISDNLYSKIETSTLVIMCCGTGVKAVLFIVCYARRTNASSILAIDQRNDCITNIVALAGAYTGERCWKYADPIGAVLVSGFIIITWLLTVREQVPLLIGRSANLQFINRIVNVAINHDDRIKHLDTVYVYHFGANFLVELHVVMDREITLGEAHDVSETLQVKLEKLPFVERAFVHCDYQFDGDEHV